MTESREAGARISIVTAVRNDAEGFARTRSSIHRAYPAVEHVVIDASDRPIELPAHAHTVTRFGRDKGIAHAFNLGIMLARRDYVWFVNSGDEVTIEGVNQVESALRVDPDCLWFAVRRISLNGSVSTYRPRLHLIHYAMSAPHQGMLVRRELFAEVGLFPLQRYAMDHHLALRVARVAGARHHLSDDVVATYPAGGHSTQAGFRPFVQNVVNTARIAPARLPVAVFANLYLACKNAVVERG